MNKPSNKNFVNKTILAKSIVSCHIIRKVCLLPMTINITVGVDDGQSRYLRTKRKADKLWSIEESEEKSFDIHPFALLPTTYVKQFFHDLFKNQKEKNLFYTGLPRLDIICSVQQSEYMLSGSLEKNTQCYRILFC